MIFHNIKNNTQYQKNIQKLVEKITEADAILVGAAAGMSIAAGYNYFYQNDSYFYEYFGDFHKKYGFNGAFNGYYYRFPTPEARWAYLARLGFLEYESKAGKPYHDLITLIQNKPHHILTTNQDFLFTQVVSEEKLSQIQGDSRYYQCRNRCHDELYYNREMIYQMNEAINENLEIPSELIPRCPKCGCEMEPWVRGYEFLEGKRYHEEYKKCSEFISKYKYKKLLLLELGVGQMTPMFIKEPFWNITHSLPQAYYITINPTDAFLPKELNEKGVAIKEDIAKVLDDAILTVKGEIFNESI